MVVRLLICASFCVLSWAQNEAPPVTAEKVRDNIYMLKGQGGNIGLCIGEDGAFLIDDQYAPATENIRKAVKEIADQPIKFVINTHWHGDHTGGNENLAKTNTVIFAHENVRKRMSTEQFIKAFNRKVEASPKEALPVVTFTKDIAFHLNGETIRANHYAHAHTDGDAVIFFKKANVVHMGDIYFNGMYPFIDGDSGGSIGGMIKAVSAALENMDNQTLVIPGHGPVSNKKELTGYRDMLKDVETAVRKLKDSGKTLEETIAAKPSGKYDEKLGNGYFKTPNFIGFVYNTLK